MYFILLDFRNQIINFFALVLKKSLDLFGNTIAANYLHNVQKSYCFAYIKHELALEVIQDFKPQDHGGCCWEVRDLTQLFYLGGSQLGGSQVIWGIAWESSCEKFVLSEQSGPATLSFSSLATPFPSIPQPHQTTKPRRVGI